MSSPSSVKIEVFLESFKSCSSTRESFPPWRSCQNESAAGRLGPPFPLVLGLCSISPSKEVFRDVFKEVVKELLVNDEFRISSPESFKFGFGGTVGGATLLLDCCWDFCDLDNGSSCWLFHWNLWEALSESYAHLPWPVLRGMFS